MTFEHQERLLLLRDEVSALDLRILKAQNDLAWLRRMAAEKRAEITQLVTNGSAPRRSLDAILR